MTYASNILFLGKEVKVWQNITLKANNVRIWTLFDFLVVWNPSMSHSMPKSCVSPIFPLSMRFILDFSALLFDMDTGPIQHYELVESRGGPGPGDTWGHNISGGHNVCDGRDSRRNGALEIKNLRSACTATEIQYTMDALEIENLRGACTMIATIIWWLTVMTSMTIDKPFGSAN